MDKICLPSGESTASPATAKGASGGGSNSSSSGGGGGGGNYNNRDQYLKHLNKISHKITKPTTVRKPTTTTFDNHHHPQDQSQQTQTQNQQLQQQHQPPVYNINKSDFRDVVQKLTGSPAHERFSTPPPIHPPKPPSSRLQRIRPPPLAELTNRPPPPLLNNAGGLAPNPNNPTNFGNGQRHVQPPPLSPLPPFPAVHAAAESPISAYMRYLQSSSAALDSDPKRLAGFSPLAPLVSPRWNNQPPPSQQQQQNTLPSPTAASMPPPLQFPPSSPLPFGCLPSPRSPYPLLFSPTNQFGFQQFPLSPTLPVPSPRWN